MKKYIFSLILLLAIFVSPRHIYAQAAPADQVINPYCRSSVWVCPNITKANPQDRLDANLNLSGQNLPTNTDIYIVCGILTQGKWVFTSGNNAIDEKLCLGKNNYSTLSNTYDPANNLPLYQTVLGPNPSRTSDGNLKITVNSRSKTNDFNGDDAEHTCYFVYQTDLEKTGDPNSKENTLQYQSFKFYAAQSACTSFRQDPYGRIFDGATLKPLKNVNVSLLDQTQQLLSLAGVKNPITIESDGLFNFAVEPGTYYINTPLPLAPAHQNSGLAYDNIYQYGTPIVEKGVPEQRDISVSYTDQIYAPELNLTDYGALQLGSVTRIQGKASWPLTIVTLMQGANKLAEAQTNKFGIFKFDINNNQIDPKQEIKVILTEVDLTADVSKPAVNPSSYEASVEPIPTYIDGYVYKTGGKIMTNTTVKIVLEKNDSPYFQTKTDTDGLVIIAPSNLPPLPYYLEANGQKITTSEFADSNKQYHQQNKINIISGMKAGNYVDPTLNVKRPQSPGISVGGLKLGGNDQNLANITPLPKSVNNSLIVIAILIFGIFIVIFVIAIILFIKQLKKNPLENL